MVSKSPLFPRTPRNLQRLPAITPNLVNEIKLVEIQLPSVEGLPENCEATMDIQKEQVQYPKKAYDMLLAPSEQLLQKDLLDLSLIDFSPYWIPEAAAKFEVQTAFFSLYTASTFAYLGRQMCLNLWKSIQAHKNGFLSLLSSPIYQIMSISRLKKAHFPDASDISTGQWLGTIVEGCDFVTIRSCKEFKGEYTDKVQKLYQKPVLPIGVLPPVLTDNRALDAINSDWTNKFKWMDEQWHKSVVFVWIWE